MWRHACENSTLFLFHEPLARPGCTSAAVLNNETLVLCLSALPRYISPCRTGRGSGVALMDSPGLPLHRLELWRVASGFLTSSSGGTRQWRRCPRAALMKDGKRLLTYSVCSCPSGSVPQRRAFTDVHRSSARLLLSPRRGPFAPSRRSSVGSGIMRVEGRAVLRCAAAEGVCG